MKKLFSLFSMLILLSSNALPVFTYADSGDNELAIQILTEEVNNVGELFTSKNEDNSGLVQGNYGVNTFGNSEYTVTFNLNGGYWTEEGIESKDEKSKKYELGNQGILTDWRTPSREDLCTDGEKLNMKCMFDGWYLEEEGTTRWTGYVSKDMIVYAKWLPFEDREVIFNDGSKIIIMDRNIGATTGNIEDIGSHGYHFQWGNNYGFKLKGDNNEILPNGEISNDSKINGNWSPSKFYGSIGKTTSNWTDDFINLWGGSRILNPDTDRQGPCPKGYHVPYSDERSRLKIGLGLGSYDGGIIKEKLNLPATDYTYGFGGYINQGANYWAANTNGNYTMSHNLKINNGGRYEFGFGSSLNYLYSVRCFKDFEGKDIVFHNTLGIDIEGNYKTTRSWEEIKLPIPEKDLMIFQGWYTNENFDENSKVDSTNISSTGEKLTVDLYAKRGCVFGYDLSDDGQSCIPISIKFRPNGGRFLNNDTGVINSQIDYLTSHVTKYSHTDNLDNSGNQNGNYGYNLATNDVVNIKDAKNLHVELKYSTENNFDYLYVFKGIYSGTPTKNMNEGQLYTYNGRNSDNTLNTSDFDIDGDTITFSFYSDASSSYYGYYAIISGIGKVPTVIYPENSFDNIPEPTRENSVFKGWYFDNTTFEHKFDKTEVITGESMNVYAKWECVSGFTLSDDLNSCNPNIGVLKSNDGKGNEAIISRYVTNNPFINNGYEFIGWNTESDGNGITYKSGDIINESGLVLFAQWKALEEKAQETTAENVVYTNTTTVTVGDEQSEEILSGSSTLSLVSKEIESNEVTKEEDITKVKDSEIKVTSDKSVEYEGGLEVYLEKTEDTGTEVKTGKVEGTAKFSSPVAVKIPIYSNAETVKVQVKHEGEEFGYKGLTINPINSCSNGEAVNDKYNGENISVKDVNGEKYVLIYTCSASTFVAYTENVKPTTPSPAAGGGRTITSTKNENNISEQEHNSADTEKAELEETTTKTMDTQTIKEQVMKVQERSLTRGEVAVMTNILLEVYPQLVEGKSELDDVTNACSNYVDEQNFTKDEKKAITRLCKLSIMGIHADDNKPLDEFMVNEITKNDEFSKVINRSLSTYTEKDFSVVKDALKKLEGDEENVVFGTVYDVFMGIKNIFSK